MLAPVHIEASHNTPNASPTLVTQEIEDRIMAALPKPLADWLRYEAVSDLCTKAVFQEWRAGTPVDRLLASLRGIRRQDTRRTYGGGHPQAAFL